MKYLLSTLTLAAGALATTTCVKKKIIIDTDFFTLPDDVNAVAIANAFQKWGEAEILGVMSSVDSEFVPAGIDVVNTYYGHKDISIAIQKPLKNETYDPSYPPPKGYGGWIDRISKQFPEDIYDPYSTPDPVNLYRTLLAGAEDHSVTIATIGFFDNLYKLVDSPADHISNLTGWQLITQKVAELVVQADPNTPTHAPFNIGHHNPLFAAHVLNSWPTMLTFLPGYVGRSIQTGNGLGSEPETSPTDFVWNATIGPKGLDGGWDPAAMYYAIRGLHDVYHYNITTGTGVITVDPKTGGTTWNSSAISPGGKQNWVDLTMAAGDFAGRLDKILLWDPSTTPPPDLLKCSPSEDSTETDSESETTESADETTESADETTESTDETTESTDETTESTDETTESADETTVPTESGSETTVPTESPSTVLFEGAASSVVIERGILVGAAVILAAVLAL